MSRSHMKELDLEIEIDVLTSGALAEIVNSLLEFLLYQRNQIEFVYRTFRGFVNEWSCETNEAIECASIRGYMLERQREKAIQTKESISEMRRLISSAFDNHLVKSIRFLFGSTTFTPKEAYTIHLPAEGVSNAHLYDHHQLPQMRINQLLLTLLTREDLYGLFSKDLCLTNLHLELEILQKDCTTVSATNIARLYPKQIGRLPASCKDIHLHLRHKLPANFNKSLLNCCKELTVFDEQLHEERSFRDEDSTNNFKANDFITNWWETDIIVRGFKQKIVKGKSIWTK